MQIFIVCQINHVTKMKRERERESATAKSGDDSSDNKSQSADKQREKSAHCQQQLQLHQHQNLNLLLFLPGQCQSLSLCLLLVERADCHHRGDITFQRVNHLYRHRHCTQMRGRRCGASCTHTNQSIELSLPVRLVKSSPKGAIVSEFAYRRWSLSRQLLDCYLEV